MRRALVRLHLWLGLTVGLFWALQGLTGALLVFGREIDHLMSPTTVVAQPASLDRIVAAARSVVGTATIERLALTDTHRSFIDVYCRDAAGELQAVRVNATDATVVGTYPLEPSTPFQGAFMRWVYVLHSELTSGQRGETLIGISGLLLLTTAMAGLWIAWPRKQRWREIFAASKWRKLVHRLFGWHRAVGISASLAFLLATLTGAGMIFEDSIRAAIVPFVPYQLSYSPMRHGSGNRTLTFRGKAPPERVGPQSVLETAQARFPEAKWVRLFLPTAELPYYAVRLHQRGETRAWIGATSVVVDPISGRVIDVYDALHAPVANRIFDALYPVHTGEVAGPFGRVLTMFGGLALVLLYLTGVTAFVVKYRKRNGAQRLRAPR